MAYEEENKREVFYIPQNYEDAGGIMGGHFKQRNIIETCVVCLPILIAEYNFIDLPLSTKIVIILVTVLPLACLFALGIKGESVTQIVLAFFRYLRNRRRLSFVGFVDKGQRSFMPDPWALETLKESIKQRGFIKAIIKAISDTKKLRKIRRDLSIEIEIRENGQQVVVKDAYTEPKMPEYEPNNETIHITREAAANAAEQATAPQEIESSDEDNRRFNGFKFPSINRRDRSDAVNKNETNVNPSITLGVPSDEPSIKLPKPGRRERGSAVSMPYEAVQNAEKGSSMMRGALVDILLKKLELGEDDYDDFMMTQ